MVYAMIENAVKVFFGCLEAGRPEDPSQRGSSWYRGISEDGDDCRGRMEDVQHRILLPATTADDTA